MRPRLLAVLLLSTFARAQPPQPPCSADPFPAYPAPGRPPAVKVWDRSTWTPPPCVGWIESPSATVVAVAARIGNAGSVDALRRRIAAISQLSGLRYWSTTNQRWQTMIVDAYALSSSAGGRRTDFSLDEIAEGATLYVQQEDNLFGKAIYRLRILHASPDRLVFSFENTSPIRFLSVPVLGAGDVQSIVFCNRESKDVVQYFSLARFGKQASLLGAGHEASLINRAVASYRYLAGIPSDLEPPAAR